MAEISKSLQYLGESLRQIPASIGKSKREEALFRLQGAKFDYQIARDKQTQERAGERHDVFMDKARAEQIEREENEQPFRVQDWVASQNLDTDQKDWISGNFSDAIKGSFGEGFRYQAEPDKPNFGYITDDKGGIVSKRQFAKNSEKMSGYFALLSDPMRVLESAAGQGDEEAANQLQRLRDNPKEHLKYLKETLGRKENMMTWARKVFPQSTWKNLESTGIKPMKARIAASEKEISGLAKEERKFGRQKKLEAIKAGRRETSEEKSQRKIIDSQIQELLKRKIKGIDPVTSEPLGDNDYRKINNAIAELRKQRKNIGEPKQEITPPSPLPTTKPLSVDQIINARNTASPEKQRELDAFIEKAVINGKISQTEYNLYIDGIEGQGKKKPPLQPERGQVVRKAIGPGVVRGPVGPRDAAYTTEENYTGPEIEAIGPLKPDEILRLPEDQLEAYIRQYPAVAELIESWRRDILSRLEQRTL